MDKSIFTKLKKRIEPRLSERGYQLKKSNGTSSQLYQNFQEEFTYQCELLTRKWWHSINGITFHKLLHGVENANPNIYHVRINFRGELPEVGKLKRKYYEEDDLEKFINRTLIANDILMKQIKSESDAINIFLSEDNNSKNFLFNDIISNLDIGSLAILNNRNKVGLNLLNRFLKEYPLRENVSIDKIRIEFAQNLIKGLENGTLDSINVQEFIKKFNEKVWNE